jgi:hypothetical protein
VEEKMRPVPLTLALFCAVTLAPTHTARADALADDLKARIEAAHGERDEARRLTAVRALFHHEGLDKWSEGLAERMAKIVVRLRGHQISFAAVPPGAEFLHVVNGYEYRPNLKPRGHVVFTDAAKRKSNDTKVLYAVAPGGNRYVLPLTVRKQVNAAAPRDKQLQMLAMGIANPPLKFHGWCDIMLSNGTTKRIMLGDQGVGNQTRIMRGQKIKACELTKDSRRGALSLRLFTDDKTLFEQRIEAPQTTITYHAP